MSRRSLRASAAAVAVAFSVAACAGTPTTDDAAPAAPAPASSSDDAPDEEAPPAGESEGGQSEGTESASEPTSAGNADALAFTGVDLSGGPIDGKIFAGGDVILWMWAPW